MGEQQWKNAGTIVGRESHSGKNNTSRYGHGGEPHVLTDKQTPRSDKE